MTDPASTPAATPPATPPSDPPATPPAATEPPATDPPADPGAPKLSDLDPAVQRLIQNQRDAERRAVARAEAAEEKVTAAEREKLGEKERAEAEAKDAREDATKARREANEARLQVRLASTTIKRTIKDDKGEDKEVDVTIADPELAADALLKSGVTFADNGTIENFEERVTQLLRDRPVLAANKGETPAPPKRDAPTANGGTGGNSGETPPKLTAEQVKAANESGMTPEEYDGWSKVGSIEDFQKLQSERSSQPA